VAILVQSLTPRPRPAPRARQVARFPVNTWEVTSLADVYRPSLSLLTDLYQITMAYGYWREGRHDGEAVFHLSFRENPFAGGFALACGLHRVLDLAEGLRFESEDLAYLASLEGADGRALFHGEFLEHLGQMRLACDLDAVPEGTVVFPHEPLVRVRGPLSQCQLLETPLLNLVNFETLIATKAARVCLAAHGEPVLEFGLRRAQGVDGALSASRAAYVGGCSATSNALAGRLFGIPVKGTHAHSWVMSFPSEAESFAAYARAMPNNVVLLVDTFDTLQGVRRAVEVGRALREAGHDLLGIRLDSGDLAYLSAEARRLLDEAGFQATAIMASNDLDERVIASLKQQGAPIGVWGVGTHLVTGGDQPALGGVYKLGAVRGPDGRWQHKVKLSEQAAKVSTPGVQQVRRYADAHEFVEDLVYDEELGVPEQPTMVDPLDPTRRRRVASGLAWEELLLPVVRAGRVCYERPGLEAVRRRVQAQLARFHAGVKRFVNPHRYPVGLESGLHDLKTRLVLAARGLNG
jgi:nicotinate phosphoribosyltransferase